MRSSPGDAAGAAEEASAPTGSRLAAPATREENAIDGSIVPRAFALLYGAGGSLVLVTLPLTSSDSFLPGMIVPALIAYAVTALTLFWPERLPLSAYQSLPAFGGVLVTAVAYSSSTGAFNAYALLYVWVIVSGFYFFPWRRELPALALVSGGYGLVLLHHGGAHDRLLYWVMGVGTLVVESLLLATLRDRLEILVGSLRESDQLKTTIIRSVSHDFRTPLTAIIAAGESSASSTLDIDSRREVASVIVTEASRLSETLAKLLDMSRLEAGAATPHGTWCAVEEVVETALDHTLDSDNFEISVNGSLPVVWADAAQLERAFFNLFENASRFGGGEPVEVTLEAAGRHLVVRVSDRGPGVDPDERELVFEPFYRGRRQPVSPRGPGHGLAIAKGFIETNGGHLWVAPGGESGSTFVVELRLGEPES